MKYSSLEITEQEYLIKLRKDDFDLPFIYQLLKRIQTEQYFFSKKEFEPEEDIISRNLASDGAARFDRLCDK
ncbi:MAG: hypothetical protein H7096_08865 [Flavobacterium sp.]|nr:hypothetical protein [Pedobacter sp.]